MENFRDDQTDNSPDATRKVQWKLPNIFAFHVVRLLVKTFQPLNKAYFINHSVFLISHANSKNLGKWNYHISLFSGKLAASRRRLQE